MKFTNQNGKIKICVKIVEDQIDSGSHIPIDREAFQTKDVNLQISIVDTGVGMSEKGLKGLFIDFGKLAENEGRNRVGTGLGLSISKKVIEQMGGSIDVKS